MSRATTLRNFCIIAHIDHGKSTLSDRLIEQCGALTAREMSTQVLDSMDLERERGITIKSQSVTLSYTNAEGIRYQLNLIDTPGHVDFAYEVSRSLAACEGALLVVDATQGVEAQTVANCYTAVSMGLTVQPVLNKLDLPTADPQRVCEEIETIIGLDTSTVMGCSAKTGEGIQALLEHIVASIPPPQGDPNAPTQALIIDSWFDNYLGVVSLVRVKQGQLRKGDKVLVMHARTQYCIERLGIFTPKREDRTGLECGEVGWVAGGIKEITAAPVGDTLTLFARPAEQALPGFSRVKPQVYAGLFPLCSDAYENFRVALGKLSLNDASLTYEPESSSALGCGFRCGFLGLLHMEIVQARLEREAQLALIMTLPSVEYRITHLSGTVELISNPANLPVNFKMIEEPIALCHILVPQAYVGAVITLCSQKRGEQISLVYHAQQVALTYAIAMAEVVVDLFDQLKSISRGYASLEYAFDRFQAADIVRLDILVNAERIDALTTLTHREPATSRGRQLVEKMQQLLPRQQFDIAIQAAIGNQIVARTTIRQYRKNVTGKCYGGDVTRKQKLLNKQKEGKKRMKRLGAVEISQEAFFTLLNVTSKIKGK